LQTKIVIRRFLNFLAIQTPLPFESFSVKWLESLFQLQKQFFFSDAKVRRILSHTKFSARSKLSDPDKTVLKINELQRCDFQKKSHFYNALIINYL